MKWQPIETAPRDGTWVLLSLGKKIPFVGAYDDGDDEPMWFSFNLGYENSIGKRMNKQFAPTHWMPLPPAPEADDVE